MNYFKMALFTAAILVCGIVVQAQTTVTAPTGNQTQEKKGSVDSLVDELRQRNELVVQGCFDPCSDADAAQSQVKVGDAINKPMPTYPAIARAAHATGKVVVKIMIDEEGRVIAAQAESGHPLLQAASVTAAKDSSFMPTLVGGVPAKVVATITYNFVIQ